MGYYDYKKDHYIYQYKDHLGNVRVSFGKNSAGALEITDANDYYPFGMNHLKTGNAFFGVGSYKNYKYNGKELQETGMYDYGARFYMPDLGRWGVVDPMAEKYFSDSPFNYVLNNPISYIDPFGMDIYKLGADGSIAWVSSSKEDQIYAANQFNKDNSLIKKAKGFTVGEQGYISKNTKSGSFTDSKGNEKQYSMITFQNEDTALGLHEYISNNVEAEFAVGSGMKDGQKQSIVGKNGALNKPANEGSISISPYLDYFDQNSISLFGHNHPDRAFEIEPSGYDVQMTGWKGKDYTSFENINNDIGKPVKTGDKDTSSYFPNTASLFMYNPKYFTGPKTVYYNREKVTSIKNGHHKSSRK
ncbi:RHS repeat-associated core domain-containing protein [Chryseobacterium sp.]|uniref:RHS repeat domain-containing protein n=1 Tax=Chryseobacterium sp. TaxID=1871047 RepID=UPI002353A051|nr:RHS repeat-associated core domain-containing protein [Chryseobacterium sp.]